MDLDRNLEENIVVNFFENQDYMEILASLLDRLDNIECTAGKDLQLYLVDLIEYLENYQQDYDA
jgi:hypothetical protein